MLNNFDEIYNVCDLLHFFKRWLYVMDVYWTRKMQQPVIRTIIFSLKKAIANFVQLLSLRSSVNVQDQKYAHRAKNCFLPACFNAFP